MEDKIVMHEDWRPGIDYVEMRRWYWREAGNLTALPNPTDAGATQGTVQAVINHGRWVTECPLGHNDAVIVSRSAPYYICTSGGAGENGGKWYVVTFPPDRAAIEAELLKRVSTHPYKDAKYRTWNAAETVTDLKRENAAHPEFVRK
jgi:hypothetical protein